MRRTLSLEVNSRAFAPETPRALKALGYRLIDPKNGASVSASAPRTDLRLIDAKGFSDQKWPSEIPIVLFTRGEPRPVSDPRVVGFARRPVDIATLYPVLQNALESTPRQRPRASAQLPARCTYADRRFMGALLSISEMGCLFRSSESLPEGRTLNLIFPLPRGRMVSTRARVIGRTADDTGLRFESPDESSRSAIAEYVVSLLTTR